MRRFHIIGGAGSGKTTLAKELVIQIANAALAASSAQAICKAGLPGAWIYPIMSWM